MTTRTVYAVLCLAALALLAGCFTAQNRADIQASAQTSYNAAAALPAAQSDIAAAIEANQVAIAAAAGTSITTSSPTTAPAVTP
jgi:hypothetical protein